MLSASGAEATYRGENEGDRAGTAVASAGDVDDDGSDDLLIGAPFNNSTAPNAGAAYLVTERGEASLSAATKMNGEGDRDLAGWSLSDAGDIDGDGVDDVVVGAPYNDTTGASAGAAYVVLGGDSLPDEIDLADADLRLRGESDGDLAGWSVSSAGSGDVTCDEFDDVVVGAPGSDANGNDSGSAYLIYGDEDPRENRSLGAAGATLRGEAEGDRAGVAVADVNDTSGDGNEDIAVGAPRNDTAGKNSGAAYVVNGQCPVEEEEPETTTEEPDTTTERETTEKLTGVDWIKGCFSDGGEITVTNTNAETTVRVEISGPNGYSDSATPGPALSVPFSNLDDGEYVIETFVDGDRIDRQTVTIDCDEDEEEPEGVDIETQCVDGQGEMTITNPNDEEVIIDVYRSAVYSEQRTLQPGESVTLSGLDNGSYTVETIDADSREIIDLENVEIGCKRYADVQRHEPDHCKGSGGAFAVFGHAYNLRVEVTGPNGYSETKSFSAATTAFFTDLEDGEYTIKIYDEDQGKLVQEETITIDCGESETTTDTTTESTSETTTDTTSDTSSDTSSNTAAISFVAFCVEGEKGPGNDPCPDGERLLVKFNENGGSFSPEGGDSQGVSVSVTDTKDDGEPIEVSWTSSEEISSVIVKSSTDTCEHAGGTSGTAESCGPPPGQQADAAASTQGSPIDLGNYVGLLGLVAFAVAAFRGQR